MKKILLLPFVLLMSGWTGLVTEVRDGNGLTVLRLDNQTEVEVRLWGIDAPEIDQPFGLESHDFLQSTLQHKKAEFDEITRDMRGKYVAKIQMETVFVNQEMIRQGLAWIDSRFQGTDMFVTTLEEACKRGVGLWADKSSVNPRLWRKLHRRGGQQLDPVSLAKGLNDLSKKDPEMLMPSPRSKSNYPPCFRP